MSEMSEERKPLTDHLARSHRRPMDAARPAWITVGVLVVALIAVLLLWAVAVGKVRSLEALRPELDDANAGLAGAQAQIQKDKDQIAALQSQITDLQQQTNTVTQTAQGLENEMRTDLESKDVTISNLQGKLTVNILDNVLFDSGEAILKPDGQAVMRKIAAILAEHQSLKIHVIGYTDNVPIRPDGRRRFASNWELSTARALAAVHFLTEDAGVDPRRVGAVGYGEFRPIADNATPEGRAKNRRIAITILPDELAVTSGASKAPAPIAPAATLKTSPVQPTTSDTSGPPGM